MEQEVTNFAKFYALFNQLPCTGDREELKRSIVREYTWNRTESLREMTQGEYLNACDGLEKLLCSEWRRRVEREDLRYWRSVCLKLMGRLGIDTSDWARVDAFCLHPRICRKKFARITTEELKYLSLKLRSIQRRGGLKNYPMEEAKDGEELQAGRKPRLGSKPRGASEEEAATTEKGGGTYAAIVMTDPTKN